MANEDRPFSVVQPEVSPAYQLLSEFKDSDIKFRLEALMNILRDNRHEGWVLAAYPDPKTGRPLIGAGFNLDVRGSAHVQRNPLNAYQFIEPSTPELWQAVGLDMERLQAILDRYDLNLKAWKKERFRKRIRANALSPELTEDEGTRLLRISALQAIHNARAYCGCFDQLSASQQMALSELVFQMGVNLEGFVQFLSAINDYPGNSDVGPAEANAKPENEHWKTVQHALVESYWARRYTSRAIAVIAMFNPNYEEDPRGAERQVQAQIRPLGLHRRKNLRAKSVRARKTHRSHA